MGADIYQIQQQYLLIEVFSRAYIMPTTYSPDCVHLPSMSSQQVPAVII